MTGPEHYKAAEDLLAQSHIPHPVTGGRNWFTADGLVAEAAVHATLGLAASHALMGEATDPGWWDVAAPSTFVPKEVSR